MIFLVVATGSLLYRAREKRGYLPFILGVSGAITILVSKFAYNNNFTMYIGLSVLIIASLMHSWPRGWTGRLFRRLRNPEAQE